VAAATRAASIALPLPAPWKRTHKPPVRRDRPAADRGRAPEQAVGLGRRVGSFAVALPDHPWLDRVVRGRAWIPLLGVLLVGIVAAQVEILKLGARMGRALEQTTNLTTQNEQLRGNVARLADDQRIERLADGMGLVFPPPGAVGYIDAGRSGDGRGALGNLHAPDAAVFVALAPKNGALVTGPGTSTLPPSAGAPLPPTTATTPTTTPTSTSTPTSSTGTSSTATTVTNTTSSQAPIQAPATTSQAVPTTSPAAGTTSSAPASTSQSGGATSPAPPTTSPTQSSTASATGAAAIQPSGTSQQSGGG
jgi:hypothetical protein